jgi:hypothetical protein
VCISLEKISKNCVKNAMELCEWGRSRLWVYYKVISQGREKVKNCPNIIYGWFLRPTPDLTFSLGKSRMKVWSIWGMRLLGRSGDKPCWIWMRLTIMKLHSLSTAWSTSHADSNLTCFSFCSVIFINTVRIREANGDWRMANRANCTLCQLPKLNRCYSYSHFCSNLAHTVWTKLTLS